MTIPNLSQLEACSNELAIATKNLGDHCRGLTVGDNTRPALENGSSSEVQLARQNVLAIAARLQSLLAEPEDLIQHLASQV